MQRDLESLKELFESANLRYEELRFLSEKAVSRWIWADAPRYHLDPLYFFNREVRPGRLLSGPPDITQGHVAYGISRDDRIVTEKQFLTSLPGRYYQAFFTECADRVLGHYFHYEPTEGCVNCSQLIFSGTSPACYQKWAKRGWQSIKYLTVDGVVKSFVEIFEQDNEGRERISGDLRCLDGHQFEVWVKWPHARRSERIFKGSTPAENPFLRGVLLVDK